LQLLLLQVVNDHAAEKVRTLDALDTGLMTSAKFMKIHYAFTNDFIPAWPAI
jgi:hypothetical protein